MRPRRGKRETESGAPGPTVDLRSKMLSLDAATVGLHPSAELPRVWGALMEMGFPDGAATIVTLADGTTSL